MKDTTAIYCARVFPPPWRIMGVPLLPLSIGHAHLLAASTPWRPFEAYAMDDRIFATGLYICSRPWRKVRLHSLRAGWFGIGLALRGRLARVDLCEKGTLFAEYLLFHTSGPRLRPVLEASRGLQRPESSGLRRFGSPLLARLRSFAIPHGGFDCLFADAYWLWSVHEETQGHLRVLNEDEGTFDDYCEAEDARAN